jgi:vitamin B12 transporter
MKYWPFFFVVWLTTAKAVELLPTILIEEGSVLQDYRTGLIETKTSKDFFSASAFTFTETASFLSLYQVQSGGPGGVTAIFLRGSEARHILYTIDGHRMNDVSSVSRDFDFSGIQGIDIKEITVLPSPEPVSYGSDAIGGVINLKTSKGNDKNKIVTTVGDFQTNSIAGVANYHGENYQGVVHLTRFETAGISRSNKKRFNTTSRDASEQWQMGTNGKAKIAANLSSTYIMRLNRNRSEMDGSLGESDDFTKSDQLLVGHVTTQKFDDSKIFLRQTFNNSNRFYKSTVPKTDAYLGQEIFNQVGFENKISKINFLILVESDYQKLRSKSIDKNISINSLASVMTLKNENSKSSVGARLTNHPQYGNDYSYSGGYEQALTKETLLMAKITKGFKLPTLYQNYSPSFGAFAGGNKDLKPESNTTSELGAKIDSFEIVTFENRFQNLIQYSAADGYSNQAWLVVRGIEGRFSHSMNKFSFESGSTYLFYSKSQQSLQRRPKYMQKLRASYNIADTSKVFFDWRKISKRYDLHNNKVYSLHGYDVTDVGATKKIKEIDITLSVKNIFNKEYEDLYGFSVMPRYAELSLAYCF